MGLNIHTLGRGKPLLCLHGWGFDHQIFLAMAESLKAQYKSYLIDLPGFGDTPLMSFEAFKALLLQKLPPHFASLGWSLGGLFATRLALEAPARVTQLINVASSPYFMREQAWPGIELSILENFSASLVKDPQGFLSAFTKALLPPNQEFSAPAYSASALPGLQSGLSYLKDWDLREKLHLLQCPNYYILGANDTIIPKKLYQALGHHFSHCKALLLEEAGHLPFVSHQARFLTELRSFLL